MRLLRDARPIKAGWKYAELSVGYIAAAAGVGWETARRAWHEVHAVLGWWSVHPAYAAKLGAHLRERMPGKLWGQHLLLDDQAHQVVSALVEAGDEWRALRVVVRSSGKLVAHCPWHQDSRPSALLHTNEGGQDGPGVCLACAKEGQPLRFYWRREGHGYVARLASSNIPGSNYISPAVGTIYSKQEPPTCSPVPPVVGVRLLGTLWNGGMVRTASKAGSAERVLAAAARQSGTEAAALRLEAGAAQWYASDEQGHRDFVPELLASVDELRPKTWQEMQVRGHTVYRPASWRVCRVTHLLVDLDAFTAWPLGDSTLAKAGERIAQRATGAGGFTGQVSIVRTSPGGVQLLFELAEPAGPGWYRTAEARQLRAVAEQWSLQEVRAAGFEGGHADRCAHAPGRMMRRPGPRITKDGVPFISTLVR